MDQAPLHPLPASSLLPLPPSALLPLPTFALLRGLAQPSKPGPTTVSSHPLFCTWIWNGLLCLSGNVFLYKENLCYCTGVLRELYPEHVEERRKVVQPKILLLFLIFDPNITQKMYVLHREAIKRKKGLNSGILVLF